MKILYYDTAPRKKLEKELGLEFTDLDTLLQKSDFVSLHIPLTKETYHLIDEGKIQLMKKTAYLINNSRGPIIDEKALYVALKNKKIAGAGLDVFELEPIRADNPLLKLDNVVVSPHISSGSYETRSKMAEMVAENLVSFFDGRFPPNLVNQKVLEVRKPS